MSEQQDTSSGNDDQGFLPPSSEEIESGESKTRQEKAQRPSNAERECGLHWWEHSAFRELALIVVTGLLAIFTAWMAWETHDLSADSQKQVEASATSAKATEKSAIATEHSSLVAESSLIITKRSLAVAESSVALSKRVADRQERFAKIETRAYVSYEKFSSKPLQVGQPVSVVIEFTNSGKTPAYHFSYPGFFKTGTGVYGQQMDSLPTRVSGQRGIVLGAGQTRTITYETVGKYTIKDSLATWKYGLFLFGRVVYQDKFGVPHFTEFCLAYKKDMQQFEPYEYYNNAN